MKKVMSFNEIKKCILSEDIEEWGLEWAVLRFKNAKQIEIKWKKDEQSIFDKAIEKKQEELRAEQRKKDKKRIEALKKIGCKTCGTLNKDPEYSYCLSCFNKWDKRNYKQPDLDSFGFLSDTDEE
tara:strand:+ start:8839 stop:9213 length:375 start_codon:yes stop_codon:yes gene_type:complete